MENKYQETIDFLFNQLADFSRQGATGYKPGLERVEILANGFGNPHVGMPVIHVGGTNGKGSTSHTLAAILQSAGYRVGLFTSPHLIDFRERIRVDGEMIPKESVIDFTDRYLAMDFGDLKPSFFELTTVMALEYFREMKVDVAVVEVGLGGRLDSTNIVSPLLSIITNISLDHTALLGPTRRDIAAEKAGIIKPGVTAVIGEDDPETRPVYQGKAREVGSELVFADEYSPIEKAVESDGYLLLTTKRHGIIRDQLCGDCQVQNAATILTAVDRLINLGWKISDQAIAEGFAHVCDMTGLMGRWSVIPGRPRVIFDTAHNPGGWKYIVNQLVRITGKKRIVVGFVDDKDSDEILRMIGRLDDISLYFCEPDSHRALPVERLREKAVSAGIDGLVFPTVTGACKKALADSGEGDTVFVGGSNYVVAEFLQFISRL